MKAKDHSVDAGEELVKQDLITQEDLKKARERESKSGTPWYRQLIQTGKISFAMVEDGLRHEFHPRSKRKEHHSLGENLVEMGVISEAQLKEALKEQKRTGRLLGNILESHGHASREAIARGLSMQYEMDFSAIDETPSSPQALEAVPESIALKNGMIPVEIEGDRLTVLVTGPQVKGRLTSVGVILGLRVHAMLTACEDIREEIRQRYRRLGTSDVKPSKPKPAPKPVTLDAVKKAGKTTAPKRQDREIQNVAIYDDTDAEAVRFEEIAQQAHGASVMKMVSTIIEGAVNSGATDIHLDPQEPEMRVRYRIDGILHDVMSIPENMETAVVSRVKILSDLDITETRHPQDGHISTEIGDAEYDIRVATLPTFLGERVVLRLLDQSSVLSGIKDLGLEKTDVTRLIRLLDTPYGMILVTGPTGSGKTTTLYACLNQKNVMTDSIVTLEDPVEYQLSGINQVQIDPDIDLTFANTLRASLRQDIDVLLVGEIRDAETARIATRAAMTGHLVFSTLHTNDAPEAISTLRNMDVPSYLLSSALTAIVAQRLVRTICPNCRESYTPNAALLKSIGMPTTVKKLYRGAGCEECYHTGNKGRTGIFEIIEVTAPIRKLIADNTPPDKIAQTAKLKTMAMRCREKVKQGIVNAEEFLRVIRT